MRVILWKELNGLAGRPHDFTANKGKDRVAFPNNPEPVIDNCTLLNYNCI